MARGCPSRGAAPQAARDGGRLALGGSPAWVPAEVSTRRAEAAPAAPRALPDLGPRERRPPVPGGLPALSRVGFPLHPLG